MRDQLLGFLEAHHARRNAAGVLDLDVLPELGKLLLGVGDHQVAALPQLDVAVIFEDLVRMLIELRGEFGHAAVHFGAPLHTEACAARAGGAGADKALFQHDDVLRAADGEIVGDGAAGHAGADDDDIRFILHAFSPPLR